MMRKFGTTQSAHLAQILFVDIPDTAKIDLCMPELKTTKELFFVLLDLFIKGLMIMCNKTQGSLPLHEITEDQFNRVSNRMRLAGIECKKNYITDSSIKTASVNIPDLHKLPDNLPLHHYVIEAKSLGIHHKIWFNLVHNIPIIGPI
ncbi:hypothetical protein TetV_223 [Tetraselmis virus 1]|uniref:Uncharacterized protein n=1 Tax=Tetraselmis virus 1 TaxID=2060617 RepID=A0A2P0VN31_9VIRU|nr:hypothetical protein QJ968_gp223 [Tetraselmis virus 1]AUF82315.1 hypothetical protein TetV_223 [Tetraselmis virus 1]